MAEGDSEEKFCRKGRTSRVRETLSQRRDHVEA